MLCFTKYFTTVLITVLFIALPRHVKSETGALGFFAGGNSSASASRIAEQASTGYGGVAGIRFQPWQKTAPEITFRALAEFDTFGGNNSQLADFDFFRTGLDLMFAFTNLHQRPVYLLLGGGFAHVTIDSPNNSGTRFPLNSAYISPGLGMEFASAGSARFFIEGRFTDIDGKSGRDFQFWTLTAGVSY